MGLIEASSSKRKGNTTDGRDLMVGNEEKEKTLRSALRGFVGRGISTKMGRLAGESKGRRRYDDSGGIGITSTSGSVWWRWALRGGRGGHEAQGSFEWVRKP